MGLLCANNVMSGTIIHVQVQQKRISTKIGVYIPYICDFCSDNVLYGSEVDSIGSEIGCSQVGEENIDISDSSINKEEVLNDLTQTFKDSSMYTQDSFNCLNDTNVTFIHGHSVEINDKLGYVRDNSRLTGESEHW